MNVKQLIERLSKLDPEMLIAVPTDNFEQGQNMKQAKGVRTFCGKIELRTFRDAFDGESYDSEIVSHVFDEEKDHNFVALTQY